MTSFGLYTFFLFSFFFSFLFKKFAIAVTFKRYINITFHRFTEISNYKIKCQIIGKCINRGTGNGLGIPSLSMLIKVLHGQRKKLKNIEIVNKKLKNVQNKEKAKEHDFFMFLFYRDFCLENAIWC